VEKKQPNYSTNNELMNKNIVGYRKAESNWTLDAKHLWWVITAKVIGIFSTPEQREHEFLSISKWNDDIIDIYIWLNCH
jgi:hypothetical protein